MKKGVIIDFIIVILVILIGGYYLAGLNVYKQAPASQNQVTQTNITSTILIENFAFSPPTMNIKVGETVVWQNKDSAAHTIVSDFGNEIISGSLSSGGQYSHTFNTAGTYSYHCGIHTSMKGEVIVN